MNTQKEFIKIEKRLRHIESIETIEERILSDTKYYNNCANSGISCTWTKRRIRINTAILKRITDSYKRLYLKSI